MLREADISQPMALVQIKQSQIWCAGIRQTQKVIPQLVTNLAGHWDLNRAHFSWLSSLYAYTVLPLCQGCIKRPDSLHSLKFWSANTIVVVCFGDGYPDLQYWQLMKLEEIKLSRLLSNLSFFLNVSLSMEQMIEEVISLGPTAKLPDVKDLQCHIPSPGKVWKLQSWGSPWASAEPQRI